MKSWGITFQAEGEEAEGEDQWESRHERKEEEGERRDWQRIKANRGEGAREGGVTLGLRPISVVSGLRLT